MHSSTAIHSSTGARWVWAEWPRSAAKQAGAGEMATGSEGGDDAWMIVVKEDGGCTSE